MVAGEENQARLFGAETLTAEDVNLGTTAVREGYRFDETRLAAWMRENVNGFSGPLVVEQFKGGQSNPTYKLITPGQAYVLRRKPPGELLKGAHAIEREARVLQSLGQAGFPVARVHGLCVDDAVIGTWFYVMEMVEGRVFWDAAIPSVAGEQRPAYFDAMNAAMAQLHNLDYSALGLDDYGRPGNYFERQIARWSKQYLDDEGAGRDANMDRLVEWLPANIPAQEETSITHGDFRIDNVIFHPTEPRILAVLDWELSTLGHPIADFTYHAMMYRMPPDIVAGLQGVDLAALNIPSEERYIADYCARTNRAGIADYAFYLAFNFFRLAAIFHGIAGRVRRGTAASASARERAAHFPRLSLAGWQQVREG